MGARAACGVVAGRHGDCRRPGEDTALPPKNLQSRYFTASVKIADRVYHHSQQMHRLAVFPTPLKLPELGKSQFAFSVEREAGRVRPSVDIPQLRSPPIAL